MRVAAQAVVRVLGAGLGCENVELWEGLLLGCCVLVLVGRMARS